MQRSTITIFLVGTFLVVISALPFLPSATVDDSNAALTGLVQSRARVAFPESRATQTDNQLTGGNQHPLDPLLKVAQDIKSHIENDIQDYTAELVKRERVGGTLGAESQMQMKIRNPRNDGNTMLPLSAYMLFTAPKSKKGREVIWVGGENDNCLISHEAGLFNLKRFVLQPTGMLAMMGNKYPITEVGMLRLAEKLIEKGERDRTLGTCEVEVIDGQFIGGRECRLYQIIHPEPKAGFDFHIAQIFVDVERQIPLRYAAFLWPKGSEEPPLEEEYTYLDVQLNVGLTDADFDPDNPSYKFP